MFLPPLWKNGHLIASCLLLASCATVPLNRETGTGPVITAGEIAKSNARTAYDAVVQLRPLFFQTRGANSILLPTASVPDVSVDDSPTGDISTLREIPAADVRDIRMLDRWEAGRRFGGKHDAGTILVRIRIGGS